MYTLPMLSKFGSISMRFEISLTEVGKLFVSKGEEGLEVGGFDSSVEYRDFGSTLTLLK